MRHAKFLLFSLALLCVAASSFAQPWSGILDPSRAIDWSSVGVPGGIPNRTAVCATVQASAYGNGSSDATPGIQSALDSCGAGEVVQLSAGKFRINTSISIPSNVTLRGAGANQTILDVHGSTRAAINFGSTTVRASDSVSITGGSTKGSTSITVSDARNISTGTLLLITQLNDPSFVSKTGSSGDCTWCDLWNGDRALGQTVRVTSVNGTSIGIEPGLYYSYNRTPLATPFQPGSQNAGVEDLQVYANNTGYTTNFEMSGSVYCWIKGVEGNYADGDHVRVLRGFRNEVRDSYFHDAFKHVPGQTDADVFIAEKSSGNLIENNILIRLHASIILNWGASGNVIAYNYMDGNFASNSPNATFANVSVHGSHPAFNLIEGNIGAQISPDAIWGTSSHNTLFRNWWMGTQKIYDPMTGRGNITGTGWWSVQMNRAIDIEALSTSYNIVADLVGSTDMNNLQRYNEAGHPMAQQALVKVPQTRSYDAVAYGLSFGYPDSMASTAPYTTAFLHGVFNEVDQSITWANGTTHTLPPSFYHTSKPSWFGSTAWPPLGPDVSGGDSGDSRMLGHANRIPAQACYFSGGSHPVGTVISFNAASCYGNGTEPPNDPCQYQSDLNGDGTINESDYLLAKDWALTGRSPCPVDSGGVEACSVVLVQRVANAIAAGCTP